MQLGIHLPHIGRKAGPDSIRRVAVQAEELGFDDVWVSEHIIVPKDAALPALAQFLGPGADADLGGGGDETGPAGHFRPGAAAAPSAAAGEGTGHAAEPVRRAADPGGRRRLAGGGVRRAGRAVQGTRAADGRGHRHDAGGVDAGPGHVRQPMDSGESARHARPAAAGRADSDLDRRVLRRGDQAGAAAGRVARQPGRSRPGGGRGEAAAGRTAGRGFHHFDPGQLQRATMLAACGTP